MNKVKAFFVLVLTSILIACGGGGGGGASVITGDASIPATTSAAEMEPNDSPLSATALTTGTTMNGQLSSELDQDWYKVTATSAGTISIAFAGSGRNTGGYGWSISVLDSASTVLAATNASEDASNSQKTINIGVGAAGTYFVRIKKSEVNSYASSNYTLNLSISATTNAAEMEPNDSPLNATALTTGTTMNGQLSGELDQDWYKVTATSAGTISVAFAGSGRNTGGYGWSISVLDSASTALAATNASEDASNSQKTINIGVGAAGTYFVRIKKSEVNSYASSNYTINTLTP